MGEAGVQRRSIRLGDCSFGDRGLREGQFPHQSIHFVSVEDGREIGTVAAPTAYIEGRNAIAFSNDNDVLFAARRIVPEGEAVSVEIRDRQDFGVRMRKLGDAAGMAARALEKL